MTEQITEQQMLEELEQIRKLALKQRDGADTLLDQVRNLKQAIAVSIGKKLLEEKRRLEQEAI